MISRIRQISLIPITFVISFSFMQAEKPINVISVAESMDNYSDNNSSEFHNADPDLDRIIGNSPDCTLTTHTSFPLDLAVNDFFSIKNGALLMGKGMWAMLKGLGFFCMGTAKFGMGSIIVVTIGGKYVVVKTYEASVYTCSTIRNLYLDRKEVIKLSDRSGPSFN